MKRGTIELLALCVFASGVGVVTANFVVFNIGLAASLGVWIVATFAFAAIAALKGPPWT